MAFRSPLDLGEPHDVVQDHRLEPRRVFAEF
jgi:hypothetical protein